MKDDGEPDGCVDGSKLGNADGDLEVFCDGAMLGKDNRALDGCAELSILGNEDGDLEGFYDGM